MFYCNFKGIENKSKYLAQNYISGTMKKELFSKTMHLFSSFQIYVLRSTHRYSVNAD